MTSTLPDLLPSLGYAAPPRFHPAIWPLTAHSDDEGRLCIGEVPLTSIADEFRTPTYVVDETDFRSRARRYRAALRDAEVVYAGESLLNIAVARWARGEGLGLDVCSAGELAAAWPAAWKSRASSCTAMPSRRMYGVELQLGRPATVGGSQRRAGW